MKYDFFCHQISIVQMKFVIIQNFPSAKIHTNSNIFRNPEHISADISTLVLLPRSYEQSHRLFSLIRNTDNQHVSAALEVWRASVIQTSTELYYHSLPLGDSFTFHASETKLQHSPLIYIYQRLALKIKNNIFIHLKYRAQVILLYDTVMKCFCPSEAQFTFYYTEKGKLHTKFRSLRLEV